MAQIIPGETKETKDKIDSLDPKNVYIGEAKIAAVASSPSWRIMKIITDSNGETTTYYADGNLRYDKVWDSRATYTYS